MHVNSSTDLKHITIFLKKESSQNWKKVHIPYILNPDSETIV